MSTTSQRDRLFSIFDKVQVLWVKHYDSVYPRKKGDYWLQSEICLRDEVRGGASIWDWLDHALEKEQAVRDFENAQYAVRKASLETSEEELDALVRQFVAAKKRINAKKAPPLRGFWRELLNLLDAEGLDREKYIQDLIREYKQAPGTAQWFTTEKLMLWLVWNA